MELKVLLAGALFAVSQAASQACGMDEPPPELLDIARTMKSQQQAVGYSPLHKRAGLVIPTYLHVVESADKKGTVTSKMLEDQMKVLNETFAPHNIQFILRNTTFTVNDEWASRILVPDKAKALRQGKYDELNIYFDSGMIGGQLTGWCEFPAADPINTGINGTSYYVFDGCHVNPDTLPGGAGSGVGGLDNKGKTATHEVGHWFGLFHTFQGFSCDDDGDFIDDTPTESTASRGCPTDPPKDSCPGLPGVDPIHNYMDYSSHDCQTEFTPLQEERMYAMFNALRAGK